MYKFNKACVYKGRVTEIVAFLVDELGNDFYQCSLTAVQIRFENQDGTHLEKEASGGLEWGVGQKSACYKFSLTAEETAALKLGVEQSAWIKVSFGANAIKHEIKKYLTVLEDLY